MRNWNRNEGWNGRVGLIMGKEEELGKKIKQEITWFIPVSYFISYTLKFYGLEQRWQNNVALVFWAGQGKDKWHIKEWNNECGQSVCVLVVFFFFNCRKIKGFK